MRTPRGLLVALVTLAVSADIIAYSIAVPVLPDIGRRFGASPGTIGLLFASFGVTLFLASIPMGAVSDRAGRKRPMIAGLAALAIATVAFAFADRLVWLFAARLVQGAADAVTWVVGLAVIADLYGPGERGRMTGIVMSGASFSYMIGPSAGGWLYDIGGLRLPFLVVAALSTVTLVAWLFVDLAKPAGGAEEEQPPIRDVIRAPNVARCVALVIVAAATLSMIEPIGALRLSALGSSPARIGLVFGAAALTNSLLHPVFGRLGDRFGAETMTIIGLIVSGCVMPLFSRLGSFEWALVIVPIQAAAISMPLTPSLAYMVDAVSQARGESHGVAYGVYNVAWAIGLLGGPAIGGYVYELLGFSPLILAWAPAVIISTVVIARSGRKAEVAAVQ
jgi:MFS transporter, DHA1 family, solute carrier family 18 (vesicular amine transporter), member 1/2